MSTIRKAVVREIKRRKQTPYAFSKAMKGVHPVTLFKWLYSGRRVSLDMAEKVMRALDLVIVPKDKLVANGGRK